MAKETSFILGMEVVVDQTSMANNTPFSDSIDVSAYVDIPSGRMLKIKAANFRITDSNNVPLNPLVTTAKAGGSEMDLQYHLSTARKNYRISLADTNVIASSCEYYLADAPAQSVWLGQWSTGEAAPEDWEDGFIAATDTLWLTFITDNFDTNYSGLKLSCQLECESIKVTRSDALAIAVAQATSSGN